ncbi:hypothetical protein [Planotetraspora kaengkrachanensis]|uniref:hypothetical protein n=1 Tax=Planotetraspora kaengkrachanensis TaxID=575193 RepID=UPI0031EFD00B
MDGEAGNSASAKADATSTTLTTRSSGHTDPPAAHPPAAHPSAAHPSAAHRSPDGDDEDGQDEDGQDEDEDGGVKLGELEADGSGTEETESGGTAQPEPGNSTTGAPDSAGPGRGGLPNDRPREAESGHWSVTGGKLDAGKLNAELPSDDLAWAVTSAHHSGPHGRSPAPEEDEGCGPRAPATPTPFAESKL